ncbi:Cell-division control histidine kinase PdhS [Ensifer adhaerens]|uniref:PAS domain-containing sensor histidine kinase n=1 Tax=Ensifer adhaerens TaxID=106592 RepID=UPI001568EB13|nr:PAS domain-containing sensor histidine kinase [Ensifer adhaerens]NRP17845.1 Cell-division control histidine kinase PdhS [Ensifer adhaerens]
MPARQYPFIDIAVHERVREHFARGDAAILFSRDLSRVLWANDQGAAFFGADSIYDFIETGPSQNDLSARQLKAAATQLVSVGDRRQLLMRIAAGFRSVPLNTAVELIRVRPDELGVLFTAPHSGKPLSTEDRAARMIAGLDGPDTHMAVLDADGAIVAQSPGFANLGMSDETRRQLVLAVARDHDWLIKRPVATAKGHLPAAIGKIADEPALHLLFAVETILGNLDPDEAPAEAALTPAAVIDVVEADDVNDIAPVAVETDVAVSADAAEAVDEPAAPNDAVSADEQVIAEDEIELPLAETDETVGAIEADALSANQEVDGAGETSLETAPAATADDAREQTDTVVDAPVQSLIADTAPATDALPMAPPAQTDVASAPSRFAFAAGGRAVRFVWKIDAAGQFSEISEEFASAVGPKAADVIGASFASVSARYGLDPDNKINELLHRRDTWSGKTIFWPVEGTSLKVPVDLAALPTYSRSREFDGFRGFGIVRVADAIEDENANGLSLDRDEDPAEADDITTAPAAAEHLPVAEEAINAVQSDSDTDEPSLFVDEPQANETTTADQPQVSTDPFLGERPALRIVETPGRRTSDKIIELEQHRPAGSSALTRGEQAAFREIARQLGENFVAMPEAQNTSSDEASADATHGESERPASQLDDEADLEAIPTAASEPERTLATPTSSEAAAAEPRSDDLAEAGIDPAAIATVGFSGEILDSLPVGLLVHRGDDLLHANPEFLRLTGYETLDDFEQEGGIDALFANDEEIGDAEPDGTMTLIRKTGQLVAVTAHLHSIRWDGKSALMLALASTEASQPHESEADPAETVQPAVVPDEQVGKLKTEIDELRSILETATDGVVILGHDGDIRSVNRSASALFNYDESEIRGKPFAALFAHESQKAVIDYLQGLSGHGVASVLNDGREVIGREAAGGFLPLFMTIGRLSASNGYCAVIRDITQWKRTEEELRNAKRAAETANAHKTEFLARVSHEIRTPLNAIIGFSDMMASEHFGPVGHPRYIEYAGDIGRSGRHVLDIVNDLLDISKIEAGEMDLDFGSVEINDAVSEAVSLVQPQANSQRVIIRTSLSATVPSVVADSRSIKQIALNILANAIRFTPSGGQIVVSTSYEANGSVILRIRDTGVGMTRVELDQAMKPFRQVTTGGRKRGDGTGLGLPLTKAMAEANRAQFAITSAPNEGTLVEISFPSQRVLAN